MVSTKPKVHLAHNLLSVFAKFAFCLVGWIIALPAIPFCAFGLFFLYTYRQSVVWAAQTWRKDLLEILKFHDMVFALDKFYVRPYGSNAKMFILEGKVTLEEIKRMFVERVLNKQITVVDSCEQKVKRLKFQRLQQIPCRFGMFYFWKNVVNLNVDLHFRELGNLGGSGKEPCVTRFSVCEYLSELMTKPYPAGSALWEVVLVSNFEEKDKSAVILRLHHILADGYTFNNIVDEMIGQQSLYTVRAEQDLTRMEKLALLWKAPAWTIKLGIEELLMASKSWTSRPKKSPDGVIFMTKIDLNFLKLIRKKANCHFATVGLCILTGALRRLFLEEHDELELPSDLKIMHFLPKPAHPMDHMCNHWRVGPLKVMIDTASALKRLEAAESFFQDYMGNHFYKVMDFQCQLANLIPAPFYGLFLRRNYSTSMAFSSLPGYHGPSELSGHKIRDIYKICGLQYRQTALAAAAYTHNGTVAYTVFANRDIVPNVAAVQRLTQTYIHEELNQLVKELELDSSLV